MNNIPRQKIQELITHHSYSLLDNPRQLESLLQDACGHCKAEVFVLMRAAKEQIPHTLLNSKNSMPVELLLEKLTHQLQDSGGFEKSAARWAVETWALALGVISSTQVQPSQPSSEKTMFDSQRTTHPKPQYADLGKRFLAVILDSIILYIVAYTIGYTIGAIYSDLITTTELAESLGVTIGITVTWLYYALSESSAKQATIGKQAFKIVVTDLNGNRISFGRATGRHFAKLLSSLVLIGYLLPAFTEKKQALHDILAGCLVVRE